MAQSAAVKVSAPAEAGKLRVRADNPEMARITGAIRTMHKLGADKAHLAFFAYSAMAPGLRACAAGLAGPAQRALQFNRSTPGLGTSLVGISSPEHLDDVLAVDGISFEVRRGECFGLLGPNGAGKTTTVEIFEGLLERDSGDVEILGETWERTGRRLRERIGITLQETGGSNQEMWLAARITGPSAGCGPTTVSPFPPLS